MSQKVNDGLTGTQRHYRRRLAQVNALKAGPCTDCGGTFPPECMDFDHVRGRKQFNVGRYISGRSWATVLTEIAKCELVCANCHRTRSKNRRAIGKQTADS
jgi:hypothetical protein